MMIIIVTVIMQHYSLITKKISSKELKALHRHYRIHSYNPCVLLVGHQHDRSFVVGLVLEAQCEKERRLARGPRGALLTVSKWKVEGRRAC